MRAKTAFGDLSPERQRLIALMQALSFGRIEGLGVRNKQPFVDKNTRVIRERKLGTVAEPRAMPKNPAFTPKRAIIELFEELDRICDGVVECIEVKYGLPFIVKAEVGPGE